jgi:hypothetical protein
MLRLTTYDRLNFFEVRCSSCGLTHCDNLNCNHSDINDKISNTEESKSLLKDDRNHISMNFKHNLPTLEMTKEDLTCGYITAVGTSIDSQYFDILKLLHSNLYESSEFYYSNSSQEMDIVRDIIKSVRNVENVSKVGSHSSNTLKVKTNVRKSYNIRFEEDVTMKLWEVLKDSIYNSFASTLSEEIIDIVPINHSDIIFYSGNEKGKFDIHRDKRINMEGKEDYYMYSMVYCLRSNLENRVRSHEGNTLVVLPPFINPNVVMEHEREIRNISCVYHIFNESVIPGSFVLFPSRARHASIRIDTPNKYKLVLKMDFLIKRKINRIKSWASNYFNSTQSYSVKLEPGFRLTHGNLMCCCKICDPIGPRVSRFLKQYLGLKLDFKDDVINLIIEYLEIPFTKFGKSSQRCIGREYTSCEINPLVPISRTTNLCCRENTYLLPECIKSKCGYHEIEIPKNTFYSGEYEETHVPFLKRNVANCFKCIDEFSFSKYEYPGDDGYLSVDVDSDCND